MLEISFRSLKIKANDAVGACVIMVLGFMALAAYLHTHPI
jgi:hypothetical protein